MLWNPITVVFAAPFPDSQIHFENAPLGRLDLARRADARSKVAISRLVSKSKTRQIGIQMAYPLSIPAEYLSKTYLKGGICQEPPDLLLFAKTRLLNY